MYKKISASSWNTLTISSSSYSINATQIIQNIDTESEYNFKAVVTDYFGSVEYSHNLSTAFTLMDFNQSGKGMAIGKVSTKDAFEINMDTNLTGSFTINSKTIFDLVYPVGSIYLSVKSTNPGTIFGGTWVQWGQGRVPVGVASSGTFNYVEKTGGAETHTLTTSQIPSHSHQINQSTEQRWSFEDGGWATFRCGSSNVVGGNIYTQNSGGGGSHNNLQPYITCYMWKRTA